MPSNEELRAESGATQEELAAMRAQLVAIRAQAEARAAQLRDVLASASWRLRAPLRVAGRLRRRLLGPHKWGLARRRERRPLRFYPHVYGLVEHIADRSGCRRIIDLGCGHAKGLASLHPRFELVGVDSEKSIDRCRRRYRFGEWISADFETGPLVFADRSGLGGSLVVCAGGLGDLASPDHLLRTLHDLLEDAPYAVVTTFDRDLTPESGDAGRLHRAARWDFDDFTRLLESAGMEIMFSGLTAGNSRDWQKNTIVAVVRKPQPRVAPPPDFRVAALIYAYNEEDVIASTLEHLIGQGVQVHLVDNWSTDRSAEIAEKYLGRGVQAVTRFPESGPTGTFDLYDQLRHFETMAQESDASWILRIGADEIRESPWPGVGLRDALYRVEQEGFNAIDHTVLEFHPTGEPCLGNMPVQERMRYFEFGARPGHFCQIRGWKRQPEPVEIAWSGGHEVRFPERRVYPFKFLLRHYPIRSQEHGERKILVERIPRANPLEKEVRGWHTHYEEVAKRQSFLRNPAELLRFDDETFHRDYVVERLSGVGIIR
jgi:hypothetical protein